MIWRIVLVSYVLLSISAASAHDAREDVAALSDRYVRLRIDADPFLAYRVGLDGNDAALPAIDAQSRRRFEQASDEILARLRRVDHATLDTAGQGDYAILLEALESSAARRSCHVEWWNVSHFEGWQRRFQAGARAQPVATAKAREDAFARWNGLPAYVDAEIANLRAGLAKGYSVPRPVVARTITQLDVLLAAKPAESPFASPAQRTDDAAFRARFMDIVTHRIYPALQRYRRFLADEYMRHARTTLGVSALPDGTACYRAMLREATTLDRSPRAVMTLGAATVARNVRDIVQIGTEAGVQGGYSAIIAWQRSAPSNRFISADALSAFASAAIARSKRLSEPLFAQLPSRSLTIEAMPADQLASGVAAHYLRGQGTGAAGRYVLPLANWRTDTRGNAEVTAMHEGIPGHHLQIGLLQDRPAPSPLARLAGNDAYVEGWARYAEGLAEEVGAYSTPHARIARRAWMARGMVVDPGIHAFGWSRARAIAYLLESGRFERFEAEELVDRIVAMPGQLTAYDSGGLEMLALRALARKRLGWRFDIRSFHAILLESGPVPLIELRRRVMTWIATTR